MLNNDSDDVVGLNSTEVRSGFAQVGKAACFGCEESETGEDKFVSALYYGESEATRHVGQAASCEQIPLARKGITWMVQAFPVPDDKSSRDDLLERENTTSILPPPISAGGCP